MITEWGDLQIFIDCLLTTRDYNKHLRSMRKTSTCNNCAFDRFGCVTTHSNQGDDILFGGKQVCERGSGFGSVQGDDIKAMLQVLRVVGQEEVVGGRGGGTPGHRQRVRRDVREVELGDRAEPCKSIRGRATDSE